MFFALFDCSWRNAERGPTGPTTIRTLYERLSSTQSLSMHVEYIETDCARDNWFSSRNGGRAVFERQLETMYERLAAQALLWRLAYPNGQINVASLGGSWGGAQAAGFTRLVHERGIRKPEDATLIYEGREISKRFLAEPGVTRQVVVLFDPVGSMVQLPTSVVSGLQLVARDEHREHFRSMPIIAQHRSSDSALMRFTLPGSHSDICGGYKHNGLAIRTANLAIQYINRLSEEPLLEEWAVPADPKYDVIHRSEEELL